MLTSLDSLLLPGMRVYVSGSIRDVSRCREVMGQCASAGCVLTHDWTRYKGPKMSRPEARRQMAAIRSADLFVLVVHPRLKAGWMEFGAAVASGVLHLAVLPHPDVSESMWYTLPNVTVCHD